MRIGENQLQKVQPIDPVYHTENSLKRFYKPRYLQINKENDPLEINQKYRLNILV